MPLWPSAYCIQCAAIWASFLQIMIAVMETRKACICSNMPKLSRSAAAYAGHILAGVLFVATSAAASDSPLAGEWAVEGGFAHIRIEDCGGRLWGTISWEKKPEIGRAHV